MIDDDSDIAIHNQNTAEADAQVDQQIGAQFLESVIHGGVKIYTLAGKDGPDQRQRVALAYLAGGVPRRAEVELHKLVFSGQHTSQRIYYYVLSVFSERGSSDFTPDLIADIRRAWQIGKDLRRDNWAKATSVVRNLVEHAHSDSELHSFEAVRSFADMPEERQDEISRHLSQFIDAVVEQQLDAKREHSVAVERLTDGRRERAPLFFEPDPMPPTRYETRMALPAVKDVKRPLIGALVAVLAIAGLVLESSDLASWSGLLLVGAGCAVMIYCGTPRPAQLLRFLIRRDVVEPKATRHQRTRVDRLIDSSFDAARPQYAKDWPNYAAGYRTRLKKRFNAQLTPDDEIRSYKWLFDWHARRVAKLWPHHDKLVQPEQVLRNALAWRSGGALATLAGLAVLAAAQRWMVVPLAVGGWFALPVLTTSVSGWRTAMRLRREADALFGAECAEYDRWAKELKKRPSDGEMARWLMLDKAHLRAEAMRGSNITGQDVVSHVVINQAAPFARRAGVPGGPPRYEKYNLVVILLTKFGIRVSRTQLDLTTGDARDKSWDVFGYDRIASASLSMRDRTAVTAGPAEPTRTEHVRHLRLRLLDGTDILEVKERLALDDTDLDESEVAHLAVQTSGMDAAFPVLQAVALHGPAWTHHERDRRALCSKTWSD